jgi:16S rRNA (uracil1498-N3)-methyltransferase
MSDRFFSSSPITADHATLAGPEAHHLIHVMRAAAGQRVTLFDGSGAEFDAAVENVSRATVSLCVVERREVDRELAFPLTVSVALPKGDRQKWLVEKLTELGVTVLVPLVAERGVAQPAFGALKKLERVVIEASKQCGRNRLMQIAKPQAWAEWVVESGNDDSVRRLVAHPGGRPLATIDLSTLQPTRLAIGPEGGFSEAEIAGARGRQWQVVDLGPRILRVETAAVALAAALTQNA